MASSRSPKQRKATDLSDLDFCIVLHHPKASITAHLKLWQGRGAPLQPEWDQSHQRARRGLAFTTAVGPDGPIG